jgi:uncharacterized metal-binding protein YceD (DUF177 family)
MKLDLTELLREVGRSTHYDVQEPPFVDEDIECTRPIEGRLSFHNTGGTLLIKGQITTALALPCSRCPEYFAWVVTLHIDEQFELRHIVTGPRLAQNVTVVEEDESPVAGKLFEGTVFDLTELLRQSLILEQPTRPLPPLTNDGRCAHCLKRPEEVLQGVMASTEPQETTPVNPAFARLGQLLKDTLQE